MKVEEKVALCAIKHHQDSHIRLDASRCGKCPTSICIRACPAHLYSREGEEMKVDHRGCLECGTCLVVCPLGAVSWSYPPGGFGIRYRLG